MSRLGDVLVETGPITQDYMVSPGLSSDMRWVRADDLNALRDELIALRRLSGGKCCGFGQVRGTTGSSAGDGQ